MAKFRKKPVVIDAWQIEADKQEGELAQAVVEGKIRYCDDGSVLIATPDGTMLASPGDWVIREVNGDYYLIKSDIFVKTYEPVCFVRGGTWIKQELSSQPV